MLPPLVLIGGYFGCFSGFFGWFGCARENKNTFGIQLLMKMRKQGILGHHEVKSRGGTMRIYYPLIDEGEFVKHIVKTMIQSMMKDFPDET